MYDKRKTVKVGMPVAIFYFYFFVCDTLDSMLYKGVCIYLVKTLATYVVNIFCVCVYPPTCY